MISAILIAALASGSVPTATPSSRLPAKCVLSLPMKVATRLDEIPQVVAEINRQKLSIVDVGSDFEKYAKSETLKGPERIFVRAYYSPEKVIVWYIQRGGFVAVTHVIGFQVQHDAKGIEALSLQGGANLGGDPCAATEAIIHGVIGHGSNY